MTPLEAKLATLGWVALQHRTTTVYKGWGYILELKDNQMFLSGLSRAATRIAQERQPSKNPLVVNHIWENTRWYGRAVFRIPACPDFVSAIILLTQPELKEL